MQQVFAQIVDYAGLFPPATAEMLGAVAQYAEYRNGPDRALLGRFVVAASRLEEFGKAASSLSREASRGAPWPLAVVMGVNIPDGLALIDEYERKPPVSSVVESVELRVSAPGEVGVLASQLPTRWERYLEVPHAEPYGPLLDAIHAHGLGAKLRMGGVTPDLFPTPRLVTRFLMAAVRTGVPFKATAGLHHAVRGLYPLTYEPDSAQHQMYGFLNLLVATTLLRLGHEGETAEQVLRDDDPSAFARSADAITWRGHRVDRAELVAARQSFRGFGSCSFREPVDELGLDRVG
ncbi:MAG: hypothetical protein ABI542_03450 [Gemmatimonadota bacterium]